MQYYWLDEEDCFGIFGMIFLQGCAEFDDRPEDGECTNDGMGGSWKIGYAGPYETQQECDEECC